MNELPGRAAWEQRLDASDPRRAALLRLQGSRLKLGVALRPSPSKGLMGGMAASLRPWLRRLRGQLQGLGAAAGGNSTSSGTTGAEAASLARRALNFVRDHPLALLGVGVAAGAGLYLLRSWLLAAAALQLRRSWRVSQAILLQQLSAKLADPALHAALLHALDTWLPASPPAPAAPHNEAPSESQESAPCDESSSTKKVVSASPPSP